MSGTGAGDVVARSLILDVAVRMVFHATLAASLFFLFAGHNSPGGGFIGGLVAGAALVLRYLVGGSGAVGAPRVSPERVLGAGLLLAAATAVIPWLSGGQILESSYVSLEVPVLGTVPLASVLAFDTGVYAIVVGIVLMVLATLGARPESALGAMSDVEREVGE